MHQSKDPSRQPKPTPTIPLTEIYPERLILDVRSLDDLTKLFRSVRLAPDPFVSEIYDSLTRDRQPVFDVAQCDEGTAIVMEQKRVLKRNEINDPLSSERSFTVYPYGGATYRDEDRSNPWCYRVVLTSPPHTESARSETERAKNVCCEIIFSPLDASSSPEVRREMLRTFMNSQGISLPRDFAGHFSHLTDGYERVFSLGEHCSLVDSPVLEEKEAEEPTFAELDYGARREGGDTLERGGSHPSGEVFNVVGEPLRLSDPPLAVLVQLAARSGTELPVSFFTFFVERFFRGEEISPEEMTEDISQCVGPYLTERKITKVITREAIVERFLEVPVIAETELIYFGWRQLACGDTATATFTTVDWTALNAPWLTYAEGAQQWMNPKPVATAEIQDSAPELLRRELDDRLDQAADLRELDPLGVNIDGLNPSQIVSLAATLGFSGEEFEQLISEICEALVAKRSLPRERSSGFSPTLRSLEIEQKFTEKRLPRAHRFTQVVWLTHGDNLEEIEHPDLAGVSLGILLEDAPTRNRGGSRVFNARVEWSDEDADLSPTKLLARWRICDAVTRQLKRLGMCGDEWSWNIGSDRLMVWAENGASSFELRRLAPLSVEEYRDEGKEPPRCDEIFVRVDDQGAMQELLRLGGYPVTREELALILQVTTDPELFVELESFSSLFLQQVPLRLTRRVRSIIDINGRVMTEIQTAIKIESSRTTSVNLEAQNVNAPRGAKGVARIAFVGERGDEWDLSLQSVCEKLGPRLITEPRLWSRE